MSLRHFAGILSIGVMVIAPDVAGGQEYPNKPIRMVKMGKLIQDAKIRTHGFKATNDGCNTRPLMVFTV